VYPKNPNEIHNKLRQEYRQNRRVKQAAWRVKQKAWNVVRPTHYKNVGVFNKLKNAARNNYHKARRANIPFYNAARTAWKKEQKKAQTNIKTSTNSTRAMIAKIKGVQKARKAELQRLGAKQTAQREAMYVSKWALGASKKMAFKSLSAATSGTHYCGVATDSRGVWCWGDDRYNQASIPDWVKWSKEASCLTTHPVLNGPSSCTSCDPNGCNKHFTIIDPKTNSGTCTPRDCPTCKPKACCDDDHKHYVLNTQNLEGVCVRHTDDCTPVCVPQANGGKEDTMVKRVCSKGCNRIMKVLKDKFAKTEAKMYDIVVCQADKMVVCHPSTKKGQNPCELRATFKARAVCSFSNAKWNLGPTCIATHIQNTEFKLCPKSRTIVTPSAIAEVMKTCRKTTLADDRFCTRLGMSF